MRIWIQHEDGRVDCIELDASQTLRLGSRGSADVVLQGPDVASQHLGILIRHGVFTAVAFKKVGEIRVNGRMVRKAVLRDGDRIKVGGNLIEVAGSQPGTDDRVHDETDRKRKPDRRSGDAPALESDENNSLELPDLPVNAGSENDFLPGLSDESLDAMTVFPEIGDLAPVERTHSSQQDQRTASPHRFVSSSWLKGGVILLVIVPLVVLIGVYLRQAADVESQFLAADEQYQRQEYVSAAAGFAEVLSAGGKDLFGNEAYVKRQLALLLDSLERGENTASLWRRLKASVDQWGAGQYSGYAQAGLARLLPALAMDLLRRGQQLAEQGSDDKASESIAQASAALEMIYRLLPPDLQSEADVVGLQLRCTQLQRRLRAPIVLDDALKRLEQLAQGGAITAAYAIRGALLDEYPELATDRRLRSAMRAVSLATHRFVQTVDGAAESTEVNVPFMWQDGAVVLPDDLHARTPGREPQVVAMLLPDTGAVFGLDTANERLLWRYAIGYRDTWPPTQVDTASCVLADSVNRVLTRIDVASGKSSWRVPIRPLAGSPVVDRNAVLVAQRDGEVMRVELGSGQIVARLRLPQPLCVAPAVDPAEPRCYQVADHSLIYVLSHDQSKCLSAYYLGHERGTVTRPPLVCGEYLLVCERIGPAETELHVLSRGDQLQPVQVLSLPAGVSDSAVAIGNAVFLPSCDGRVHVLDWTPGGTRQPLRLTGLIESHISEDDVSGPVCIASLDSELWTARDGVTRYQVAGSESVPSKLGDHFPECRVAQLLRSADGTMVACGLTKGEPGQVIHIWRKGERESSRCASVAVAPAAPPLLSSNNDDFWLLSVDGGVQHGTATGLLHGEKSVRAWPPIEPGSPISVHAMHSSLAQNTALELDGAAVDCGTAGLLVSASARDQVVIVREGSETSPLSWYQLARPLASPPVAWGDRFLLALEDGPLCLLNGAAGEIESTAFLPDARLDQPLSWQRAAVLGDGRIVVSDGQSRLFLLESRVGIAAEYDLPPRTLPSHQPFRYTGRSERALESAVRRDVAELALVNQRSLSVGLTGGLIAIEDVVWGVDERQQLQRITIPDLSLQRGSVLDGEVQWGPVVLDGCGYVATTQGSLVSFGPPGAGDWTTRLDLGPLVGACVIDRERVAVASAQGIVRFLDRTTGQAIGSDVDTQQRLAFGPLLLQRRLAVLTNDCCLLVSCHAIDEMPLISAPMTNDQ